jgi:hypothetical protein
MPGSDSEDDIDDVEFDNEGEEDIEQEIFDAIEAGVEEATDGDPVCCFNGSCSGHGIADCLAIGISRGGLRRRGR